jgi:hypothetical protein
MDQAIINFLIMLTPIWIMMVYIFIEELVEKFILKVDS